LAFALGACLLAFALRGWLEALARWHWQFRFWLCSVYWEPIPGSIGVYPGINRRPC
jgi:hypothetical protein